MSELIVNFHTSALVIVKPLPEEINIRPEEDLLMNVTISASIASEDEITVSLEHSARGVIEDLTKYLVYELSTEEPDDDGREVTRNWKIDLTLPYPYSQSSGDITLNVKDDHSGDVTSTRLVIRQEGNNRTPFFDPVPKSVVGFSGDDVHFIAQARGSKPLIVSYLYKCEIEIY